jgi:hydrogenase nickel incorporation protein HypA/HybF
MHELAVCQGLLREVERVAAANGVRTVERILLRIGGLSGVEPSLLERAFAVARRGTCSERAELCIESGAVVVRCRTCGCSSPVPPNRLLCGACGDWQVTVTEGEELTLLSVDLEL